MPEFELIPVKELPPRAKRGSSSFYEDIIWKFLKSGHRIVRVVAPNRSPDTVAQRIADRIGRRSLDLSVHTRGAEVYLVNHGIAEEGEK